MSDNGKLEAMAALIAERIQQRRADRPKLRLVSREDFHAPAADSVTRECRLQRIRWLARTYSLKWLVNQHTFGLASIDCLEDADLLECHRELEKARECIAEGIPLEDVGLIRTQAF